MTTKYSKNESRLEGMNFNAFQNSEKNVSQGPAKPLAERDSQENVNRDVMRIRCGLPAFKDVTLNTE